MFFCRARFPRSLVIKTIFVIEKFCKELIFFLPQQYKFEVFCHDADEFSRRQIKFQATWKGWMFIEHDEFRK